MAQVTIGKTGITVEKNGFGALPIQRISRDEAVQKKQAIDQAADRIIQGISGTTNDDYEKIKYVYETATARKSWAPPLTECGTG